MAIEFHCPRCHKLLKTADDKAGIAARCPGCGEIVVIPADSEVAEANGASEVPVIAEADLSAESDPPHLTGPAGIRPCPVCGEPIGVGSDRCPNCGEPLDLGDEPPPAPHFVASVILSRAWAIFQHEFGVLFGVSFVLWVFQMLLVGMTYVLILGIAIVGERIDLNSSTGILVFVSVVIPTFVLWLVVTCLLQGGYRRMLLDAAQGKPAAFSQLFSGGRFFWRLLGANLLFAAAVAVGGLLLIAPGVYVVVAFWPFSFVLVDQDCGVIDAFERSWTLTTGNRLAGFVLMLALLVTHTAASMVPCFGVFVPIVTEPFVLLSLAVAYFDMNGRPTAERIPPA